MCIILWSLTSFIFITKDHFLLPCEIFSWARRSGAFHSREFFPKVESLWDAVKYIFHKKFLTFLPWRTLGKILTTTFWEKSPKINFKYKNYIHWYLRFYPFISAFATPNISSSSGYPVIRLIINSYHSRRHKMAILKLFTRPFSSFLLNSREFKRVKVNKGNNSSQWVSLNLER